MALGHHGEDLGDGQQRHPGAQQPVGVGAGLPVERRGAQGRQPEAPDNGQDGIAPVGNEQRAVEEGDRSDGHEAADGERTGPAPGDDEPRPHQRHREAAGRHQEGGEFGRERQMHPRVDTLSTLRRIP